MSDIELLQSRTSGALSYVLPRNSSTMESLPSWLDPLVDCVHGVQVRDLTRFPPPAQGGRPSSVLILFGETDSQPDLLLIERAHQMRSHSGQPAFPGGAVDETDSGVVSAALREAVEETGLDVSGVRPFALLPDLFVPPSGFVVTPVLAWWQVPSPVGVVDPAEVAAVMRVPLAELIDPTHRVRVRHPSGYVGAGFTVADLIIWGFTGGLIDRLIALAGWEKPWDQSRIVDVDERLEVFDQGPTA
ncbi:MAG: CoA pyrophosphatase [Actinomycetes bacterium]